MVQFSNRQEAGRQLAKMLKEKALDDPVVLALPRGGVPLALVVAEELNAPLDLVFVRKIGHPLHPEYAIGALTEEEAPILHPDESRSVDQSWLENQISELRLENRKRREKYLSGQPQIPLTDRTVILVDDGIATGFTLLSAIDAIRKHAPKAIVVAVPISPKETAVKIQSKVDQLIAIEIPEYFAGAIGAYYQDFSQVSDKEVIQMLKKFKKAF